MFRFIRVALGLAFVLVLSTGEVRAQWWYGPYGWGPAPGSTVQGDIAHGAGYYNLGTGIYNHETAIADAINATTAYGINQYLHLSQVEANRREYLRLARRQQRGSDSSESTYKRLKEHPTTADIWRGDALNFILDQVTDPRIHSSALRRATTPTGGGVLAEIPFYYAPYAATLCLHRLTAEDGWPIALRDEMFLPQCTAYQNAVAQVLAAAQQGKLSSQAVQAVREAVERLRAKLRAYPPSDRQEYLEADHYLKTLKDIAGVLNRTQIEVILAELATGQKTTVGSLLNFMHAYGLRFGPALTPEQHVVYEGLYPSLVVVRDQILKEAGVAATSPPKADTGVAIGSSPGTHLVQVIR